MRARTLALLALVALAPAAAQAAATIQIVNMNAPGIGFNDPTPATPVGGNPGTTLGQQRLLAFEHAASIWGDTLDSRVPVKIEASMVPLACTSTAGTLGSAGALSIWSDFAGAAYPETWYHAALADKRAGVDLDAGLSNDIRARFNSELGKTGCLDGNGWYLGFDTAPADRISLVTVLLHEFAHGLGFSSFTNVTTGELILGLTDVYNKFYFDQTLGLTRDQMTQAQRAASATNFRNVVWSGPRVTTAVPAVLANGTPLLAIASPASAAADYAVGTASFGPVITAPGTTAQLVQALDAANASGPTTTDGCTAITNDVAGKIALIDRGTCGFAVKAKNAQLAGAIGVVIANLSSSTPVAPPPGLGGVDPTVVVPTVSVSYPDGVKLKTALAGADPVVATIGVDTGVRAGATRSGFAMLYAPNPVQPGSSISHWDTSAFPNQLMEPAINPDLTFSLEPPHDLTLPLLRDIGWYLDRDLDFVDDETADRCLGSDLRATVFVAGADTGVPNEFFEDGCSIADRVNRCAASAGNHGGYVSCVADWTNSLVGAGVLTGKQKAAIQSAVAKDKNP